MIQITYQCEDGPGERALGVILEKDWLNQINVHYKKKMEKIERERLTLMAFEQMPSD